MTAVELVARARAAGLQIWPEGDLLRYRGALAPDLRDQLVALKRQVLEVLRTEVVLAAPDPCTECGSTSWVLSIVAEDSSRVCSDCALGCTRLRRAGVPV